MKRKQIVLNIVANFVSVSIGLFISFFITPYIVSTIGKEAYAFVPISNNFTSYMSILTLALTSMTSRFVTIKLHGNDLDAANDYFSTSFYSNLAMSFIVFFFSLFIIIFLDKIINIPLNILFDVRMLFALMFLGFILSLATTTFSVTSFSMNRLDVASMISNAGSLARLVVIFFMFKFYRPQVYYIGLSMCAAVIIQGILSYISSKKIRPDLIVSYRRFKFKIAKELFSSGIWNSFNQLSNILLTGIDLVMANIMLGASAAGVLAIAKTVPMALQTLVSVVPIAFSPYLTILFAKENKEKFTSELLYTLKFSAILIGIPIAGFIALASDFFGLWVPSIAGSQLTILSLLTMISMVASFSIMPLVFIFAITNKLKWPSFAVFITGLLNVTIVFILVKTTAIGIYAIAGVSSILEIFRCLIFVPIYTAICLHEKKTIFYRSIFNSLFYMSILIVVYFAITKIVSIHNWGVLLITSGIMAILGLGIGYFLIFDKEEKQKVNDVIKKYSSKLM